MDMNEVLRRLLLNPVALKEELAAVAKAYKHLVFTEDGLNDQLKVKRAH